MKKTKAETMISHKHKFIILYCSFSFRFSSVPVFYGLFISMQNKLDLTQNYKYYYKSDMKNDGYSSHSHLQGLRAMVESNKFILKRITELDCLGLLYIVSFCDITFMIINKHRCT